VSVAVVRVAVNGGASPGRPPARKQPFTAVIAAARRVLDMHDDGVAVASDESGPATQTRTWRVSCARLRRQHGGAENSGEHPRPGSTSRRAAARAGATLALTGPAEFTVTLPAGA
jgi:hypothetical protein